MEARLWTPEHLPLSDVTLHYWQSSNASLLPLVVFLHGFFMSSGCLLTPVSPLLSNFSFVLPDARGHGGSVPIPKGTFTMEHLVSDAAAVIRHVSPNSPVLLAGHSMGAATAARVARDYPNLVKGLLLVEPPWNRLPEDVLSLADFLTPERVTLDKTLWEIIMSVKRLSYIDFRAANVERISPTIPFQTAQEAVRQFDAADVSLVDMMTIDCDITLAVGNITMDVVLQVGDPVTSAALNGSKTDPLVAEVMVSRYPNFRKQFIVNGQHLLYVPPTQKDWTHQTRFALLRLSGSVRISTVFPQVLKS